MDNARIHHGEGILELVDRFRSYFMAWFFNCANLTCNRDKGRIFTALLPGSQSHRRGFLENQSVH
jgi:hypothetical protein